MGVSKHRGTQNGWFITENPIKMGTSIFGNTQMEPENDGFSKAGDPSPIPVLAFFRGEAC